MANRFVINGYVGTLEDWFLANTFDDDDILNIQGDSVLTVTQTPTLYINRISIQKGTLLIDGANAANPIQLPLVSSNGAITTDFRSTFTVTEGWFTHTSTFDGTNNQVFDFNTYWNTGTAQGDYTGNFSGVFVETGVRIPFNTSVGTLPTKGMLLSKKGDEHNSHGMVWDVVDSGNGAGHIDVKFWLGTDLVPTDQINVYHHEDQGDGTFMYEIWAGIVDSAVSIAPDIWQPFSNVYIHGTATSYMSLTGNGVDGFVFTNPSGSNLVTFGDGITGFKPMVGARLRVPMVSIKTADLADYDLAQQRTAETAHTNNARLNINGGILDIRGLNHCIGGLLLSNTSSSVFENCSFGLGIGVINNPSLSVFNSIVLSMSPVSISDSDDSINLTDLTVGALLNDCYAVRGNLSSGAFIYTDTSQGITTNRCISCALELKSSTSTAYANQGNINNSDNIVFNYNMRSGSGGGFRFTGGSNNLVNNFTSRDQTSQGHDTSLLASGDNLVYALDTKSATVKGVTLHGDTGYNSNMIQCVDAQNVKIRSINSPALPARITRQDSTYFRYIGVSHNIDIARAYIDNSVITLVTRLLHEASGSLPLVHNLTDIHMTNRDFTFLPSGANGMIRHVECCSSGLGASGTISGFDQDGAGQGNPFVDVFTSDVSGFIALAFLPVTSDDNFVSVITGKYAPRGQGDLDITPTDEFIMEMPYFALGHEGFAGTFATSLGSGSAGLTTDEASARMTCTYQWALDDGNGFNGTWVAATGLPVSGCEKGVKLKVRVQCISARSDINGLIVNTITTNPSRLIRYPIDQVENTITFTGLQVGTDVVILRAGTQTVLASVDQTAGSTFAFTYQILEDVDIGFIKAGFVTQYIYGLTLTQVDTSLPIKQLTDRNYN